MNTGDTAWMLASSALVLLMTPGLAFFYGGMVRAKSVLNMMMMSFISLAIVPVIWFVYGYSMTFGDDRAHGLIGGFGQFGLHGRGGRLDAERGERLAGQLRQRGLVCGIAPAIGPHMHNR